MALVPGDRLGPYEVLGKLGEGGMGEVYRARDTGLQRDVALKVIPAAMADNARRLARFRREARALASLNHPNIAAVHAIEDRAIVMELIDGEDLSVRLARGALPIDEALPIARQIADALAAAHDAGIVHRDLKPANIKLRPDGTVKVLDFGLAKGGEADLPGSGELESGDLPPTLTLEVTVDGATIGTAAYMAPEQARGQTVDKRADIWAFGVLLFELLTGRRPFRGDDARETLAHVLTAEPEWSALPADTPLPIRRLLRRCLAKSRAQRLHDIGDARLELDDALSPLDVSAPPSRRSLWTAVAISAAVLTGAAAGVSLWQQPGDTALTQAHLDIAPATSITTWGDHADTVLPAGGARTALAWSPDGRTLGFIGMRDGRRQVYVRGLSDDQARALEGTDGAQAIAFSPDGTEVAFFANQAIQKIAVAGGPAVRLCVSEQNNGISWSGARILFTNGGDLMEVNAAGGDRRMVAQPPVLVRYSQPHLLPDDRGYLYTEHQRQWSAGDERVMVRPSGTAAEARVLIPNAADARYLASGHLTFLRQGTLFVVPFDLSTLSLAGPDTAVLKDVVQAVVAWDSNDLTLAGQYAVSSSGTLAYVRGPLPAYPESELVSVDLQGRVTPVGAPRRGYRSPVVVSPDGTRLAVSIQGPGDISVHAFDLRRRTLARLVPQVPGAAPPEMIVTAWAPGDEVALGVITDGAINTSLVDPNSANLPRPVADSNGMWPGGTDRLGRLLAMGHGGLWVYPTRTQGDAQWEIPTPGQLELQPVWSPDGQWIAYASGITGRSEVYIRSLANRGSASSQIVSTAGGRSPLWHPRGGALFYVEPGPDADRMMIVPVSAQGDPGTPRPLFTFAPTELFPGTDVLTPFGVSPDGQRFYGIRRLPTTTGPITDIHIALHWANAVTRRN